MLLNINRVKILRKNKFNKILNYKRELISSPPIFRSKASFPDKIPWDVRIIQKEFLLDYSG